MAKFYDHLEPPLQAFIARQKMFFTATAPQHGRINLSPKGADTLRILDAHTVAYLDLTGSGNETAAHVCENGRLTLMFCSFADDSLILRLYGRGEVVVRSHPEWAALRTSFGTAPGVRQIIRLHIESAQTSCGYAVPLFDYRGERDTYSRWAHKKGANGVRAYQEQRNRVSIDGLDTGLETGPDTDAN